jgi:glycosyltransferase involved in cell wall biosynthesis
MILIDSLYINNSGGLRLLEYLISELQQSDAKYYLLADSRCRGKFDDCQHVEYMDASMGKRLRFYFRHQNDFTFVLCFGNLPAPMKMNVPVYTYFHNINLLTLAETHNTITRVKSWLKREVFRHYKKNTDYWLVQTSNTANELIKHLNEKPERVKLMPFYELSDDLLEMKNVKHGDDYVYISNYTGAKGHEELLEAWRILHKRGIDKTLHLTVPNYYPIVEEIARTQQQGVKVVNHGFIPFNKVVELYRKSKAIVYPSHNESLGLGIIEAISSGCDIIGSDLPFIHTVCKPSLTFNPYSSESIADAITRYEQETVPKSSLLINNRIDDLIDLLTKTTGR